MGPALLRSAPAANPLAKRLAQHHKAEGLERPWSPTSSATLRSPHHGADFGLWPKVEEVAETIALLVSPQNVLTSGALVPVYSRG